MGLFKMLIFHSNKMIPIQEDRNVLQCIDLCLGHLILAVLPYCKFFSGTCLKILHYFPAYKLKNHKKSLTNTKTRNTKTMLKNTFLWQQVYHNRCQHI